MLEVITEVIHEKKKAAAAGGAHVALVMPTPTEYFATILTALENADEQGALQELMALLALALPRSRSVKHRARRRLPA